MSISVDWRSLKMDALVIPYDLSILEDPDDEVTVFPKSPRIVLDLGENCSVIGEIDGDFIKVKELNAYSMSYYGHDKLTEYLKRSTGSISYIEVWEGQNDVERHSWVNGVETVEVL